MYFPARFTGSLKAQCFVSPCPPCITTQRAFNDLAIGDRRVRKTGSQSRKLEAEARWFEALPPRLMLHAYRIEFAHPGTGHAARFTARIPKDMRDFWASCR